MKKVIRSAIMFALCMTLVLGCLSSAALAGNYAKFDPAIEVTFVRQTDDTIENNLIAKLDGETLEDNRWTKLIEQELGIKVKYLWIAKGADQYTQKFNTSIASGEIPDVMLVNNVQMKNLVDGDQLADLTQVFDTHANALQKKILSDAGQAPVQAATFDGKLMGIPLTDSSLDSQSILWLRNDWLVKYGLAVPTTIDEFEAVLTAFKNGAGEGAVGLMLQKDLNDMLGGFFNAYGVSYKKWVEVDGKLAYGSVQPGMKDALAKLKDFYTKGLIDKEFTVMDGGKALEPAVAGKSGAYYGYHWSPLWPLQDSVNTDPAADWIPVQLPTGTSEPAKASINTGTSQWYVVNKNCKNPEAVVQMLNLYIDKTFDPELQDYVTYSNPGNGIEAVWKLTPVYQFTALKNVETSRVVIAALNSGDTSALFGEQKTMYEYCKKFVDGDTTMWGWYRVFGIGGSQELNDKGLAQGLTVQEKFAGAPTETMTEYQTTLDKNLEEMFTKIIVGQEPIEAFDKAVSDWYATGGQDITDEVNEWFAALK